MNKLIIVAYVLGCLACLVQARIVKVTVKEGRYGPAHYAPKDFAIDDEKTVRDLVALAMSELRLGPINVFSTLKDEYNSRYSMKKTLRESGIRDGTVVSLINWEQR